jgi:hypothetical protein
LSRFGFESRRSGIGSPGLRRSFGRRNPSDHSRVSGNATRACD